MTIDVLAWDNTLHSPALLESECLKSVPVGQQQSVSVVGFAWRLWGGFLRLQFLESTHLPRYTSVSSFSTKLLFTFVLIEHLGFRLECLKPRKPRGTLPFPKAAYSAESSRRTSACFSKFFPSYLSSWKTTSGHGWGSQRLGRPSLDSSPDKGGRPEETASKNVTETSVKNRLPLFRFLLRWAWKLQFAPKTWELGNLCSPSKASPGRQN